MGASVRQHLPFDHKPSFSDLAATDPAYPFAEVRRGARCGAA